MNCKKCNKNYLLSILEFCINNTNNMDEASKEFNKICVDSGDPRNNLSIVISIYDNDCNLCNEYYKYYKKYIDKIKNVYK